MESRARARAHSRARGRMIDTHCHLDKHEFDPDRDAVLARARAAGVSEVMVPAIDPDGWAALAAWASRTPGVRFGLGVHPQLLPELDPRGDERALAELDAALGRGGAVGLGECGLDAKSAEPGAGPWPATMDRQLAMLRGQLALARKHRLPVMLHCLRAHDPLLALLREEPLPAGGVLHSYSGSADQVRGVCGARALVLVRRPAHLRARPQACRGGPRRTPRPAPPRDRRTGPDAAPARWSERALVPGRHGRGAGGGPRDRTGGRGRHHLGERAPPVRHLTVVASTSLLAVRARCGLPSAGRRR